MKGMSLVELLICLVIVGVLAAIAMPSYQGYLIDSRRKEAQMMLLSIKLQQEKLRLIQHAFADSDRLAMPVSEFYNFSLSNVSATSFTLHAEAKDSQAADTSCATMTLDQSMQRLPWACWK